jgi:hypothetical protein
MIELPELSLFSLVVFACGGLVVALLGLLAERHAKARRAGPGLAPGLLVLAGIGLCATATGRMSVLGGPALVLAALLGLAWAARSDRVGHALAAAAALARLPRVQWIALAVGCPLVALALAAWVAPRQDIQQPPPWPLPPGTAVTDRGIDVFVSESVHGAGPATALSASEARSLRTSGLGRRVLPVAPPDWRYNCHGWILGGGRYLIPDASVELVLMDNGYRLTDQPRPGDLIVYRDSRGLICHTALVRVVQEEGELLLESKWAWMGRYLHPPDATPYGRNWSCYRSPRPGHLLRFLPSGEPDSRPRHATGRLTPGEVFARN